MNAALDSVPSMIDRIRHDLVGLARRRNSSRRHSDCST